MQVEILDVNKSLSEKTACLNTTEQDLKSIRQDKLNLEEDLESLRYSFVHIFTNFLKIFTIWKIANVGCLPL